MAAIIENQLMEDYLKIMLIVGESYANDLDRPIENDEAVRDQVYAIISKMSSNEMMALARQVIDIGRPLVARRREPEYDLVYLLRETIGLRLSSKFIKEFKITERELIAEQISYTPEQEAQLKKALSEIKPETIDGRHKLQSLITDITGEKLKQQIKI